MFEIHQPDLQKALKRAYINSHPFNPNFDTATTETAMARGQRGSAAASWRLYSIPAKGMAMQATRKIRAGENIMAEEPLVTFPPIRADVIDREQLLSFRTTQPGKIANGVEMVASEPRNLTAYQLDALRDLHGPTPAKEENENDESDVLKTPRKRFDTTQHRETPPLR